MSIVFNKISGLKAMMSFDNSLQLIINRVFFKRTFDLYVLKGATFIVDYAVADGTRGCIISDMYRQYLPVMKLKQTINVWI